MRLLIILLLFISGCSSNVYIKPNQSVPCDLYINNIYNNSNCLQDNLFYFDKNELNKLQNKQEFLKLANRLVGNSIPIISMSSSYKEFIYCVKCNFKVINDSVGKEILFLGGISLQLKDKSDRITSCDEILFEKSLRELKTKISN